MLAAHVAAAPQRGGGGRGGGGDGPTPQHRGGWLRCGPAEASEPDVKCATSAGGHQPPEHEEYPELREQQ